MNISNRIINRLNQIKMAKKKKKDLNLHFDGKNIDVDIVRKDGKLDVNIDTKHIDVEAHKDADNLDVKIEGDGVIGEKIIKGIRSIMKSRH